MTGMGTRKNLTVGVTVNLEHYENLRLEVSGEVEGDEDASDLIDYLDRILGTLGRGNPETAKRVDSYRERVFFRHPAETPGAVECQGGVCALPKGIIEEVMEKSLVRQKTEPVHAGTAPKSPAAEPCPEPAAAAAPGDQASPAMTCEECGVPVSPAEQKMSQLFTSRVLCRKCMKKA
jgi:hypothetical protein